MTWIPISEKMPEPHTKVLVTLVTHTRWGGFKEVCIAQWFEWTHTHTKEKVVSWHQDSEYVNVDGYDACIDHTDLKVTHWQPLIEPA